MNERQIQHKIGETMLVNLLPEPMRDRFVKLIISVSDQAELSPGDVLYTIGETDTDQGCLILAGALKITRSDGTVRYLESPDVIGELQLFSPQTRRTANVEVVFGGAALLFEWRELGAAAKEAFNPEELAELRKAIKHSAAMREKNLLDSLESP